MIEPRDGRTSLLLSLAISLAVCIAAGSGAVDPSIYVPFTPSELIPGAVSQDIVSFLVALVLPLAVVTAMHRKIVGWYVWLGLLGYLFYAYALYAFEGIYSGFFLIYLTILGLCAFSIGHFLIKVHFPTDSFMTHNRWRRITAIYLWSMALMFYGLWFSIVLPAIAAQSPPDGNTIFVLDMAFMLPLVILTGLSVWRKGRLGDVLVIPLLTKMSVLGISVMAGSLIAPLFDQPLKWADVAIYALLGLLPIGFALPFIRAASRTR